MENKEDKNNQKEQSKYLSRDDFEKYIDSFSIDDMIATIPKTITNPGGHIFEFRQIRFTNRRQEYIDCCKYYINTRDNQNGEDEIILVNFTGDDKIKNMLLRLYNKGYLPQYSTPKQVNT